MKTISYDPYTIVDHGALFLFMAQQIRQEVGNLHFYSMPLEQWNLLLICQMENNGMKTILDDPYSV